MCKYYDKLCYYFYYHCFSVFCISKCYFSSRLCTNEQHHQQQENIRFFFISLLQVSVQFVVASFALFYEEKSIVWFSLPLCKNETSILSWMIIFAKRHPFKFVWRRRKKCPQVSAIKIQNQACHLANVSNVVYLDFKNCYSKFLLNIDDLACSIFVSLGIYLFEVYMKWDHQIFFSIG